jgi:hypothetical protein
VSNRVGDARKITHALRGRWHGTYGVAFCPAHDNRRTPALSLSDGFDGRLLVKCHAGCAFADVLAAIRSLGIETGAPQAPALMARSQGNQELKNRERARHCWSETLPIAGTLAEVYLRGRCIFVPLPPTLRFHPSCWHLAGWHHPALVGKVELWGQGVAVHRTYLDHAGGKAKVEPEKAMLGPCRGAAVRLSAGSGPLVVAEGIETALSLLDGLNELRPRVWAALSAGGVAGLELPAIAGKLSIAPDSDDAGQSCRASEALAERAAVAGWRVRLMPAPDGFDWNDIAQRAAA